MNIAIDGPAGAGKSTIAKLLAKKLNFIYLDTGAMYRAIGLKAAENNIPVTNEIKINEMLDSTVIEIKYENGNQKIILDGRDVSLKIRDNNISLLASNVSKLKNVRIKMVEIQRQIAGKYDSILDGRDIGTYVLPNADYKFFLTASVEERAKRRYSELCLKGNDCSFDDIKKDIILRDENDSTRDFAPLKKADDAVEIDTTLLSIDEVVETLYNTIMK